MTDSDNIKFSKANPEHLDSLFNMFKYATDKMNNEGIYQWDEIYPNKNTLENDIANQDIYIGELSGEICSSYVVNKYQDKEYNNGKWKYSGNEFFVIHRLCVNPKFQSRGIGKLTMQYIEICLKKLGAESIRLDCFSENPYAFKMYSSLGYKIVGKAKWRKGIFYLMEKRISYSNNQQHIDKL